MDTHPTVEDVPAPSPAPLKTDLTCSRGFSQWLAQHQVSIAFSSYQTGQLFLVGRMPDGTVSFHQRDFERAMGLWHEPGRLFLASLVQIWRLENVLASHERANGHFDGLFVPRTARITGDVDAHELVVEASGRVVFVNTKFSCLATYSLSHSFKPVWKPKFISRLAAEDRCHLNGLCLEDGVVRYVTAAGRSDVVDGWRESRVGGGLVIRTDDDVVVADGFSMPHSPRLYNGALWVLDSGRGYLVRIDPATGAKTDVAFCPGFMRGLAFHDGHAIVTLSLPRNLRFKGMPIEDEIARRGGQPWCGVHIINLATGDVVEWIRLEGGIRELFDVTVIPGIACPMAAPLQGPDLANLLTIEASDRQLD
ncbi:TIGR03032 family protein [Niveispirillum sp. BGYR6]|uniref:TIGR03032 family protein n=1 Tax=Niveispirillum sp. BGYR6 TaxID=2971249 RepID=UPI0022B9A12D|nr:TIGR03032 family protein [Niveispirillum sp. BGYR6]MDG5496179.1 TIGR03032 family protein [Niveispirillum sp. BGYR6]